MHKAGWLALVLLGLGCAHTRQPSRGAVAREMSCKRSGVSMSEVFEDTWTDKDDGAMRLRYHVAASCSKPKKDASGPIDMWQECRWEENDWACEPWRFGRAGGSSSGSKPASEWLDPSQRGR